MAETPDAGPPRRTARRVGAAVGSAVALAFVVPLAAAAVGFDVPGPVSTIRSSAQRGSASECGADCTTASASPLANASVTPTATTAADPSGSSADAHGRVVSTVAACAPRGQDPLFTVTGDLTTHGDFVSAAAAGDTLALPFGSYDLATLAGAEALCAALEAQRAALPSASPAPRKRRDAATASPAPRPERSREPRAEQSRGPKAEPSREPKAEPSRKARSGRPSTSPKPAKSR